MDVLQPTTLHEALEAKSNVPEALPLAGGTDLMVEINFDHRRPEAILDLTRVPELSAWEQSNGTVRMGAGVTYTELIDALAAELPGLAIASRTIGSPQIRNRATVGGNLGTASPAGDALPVLLATGSEVEVASTRGTRHLTMAEFITGPKRNALEDDELIVAVHIPKARGPQQFSKIGTRNAMVIAVASFCVALDASNRRVGTGIGSAGPTPLKADTAERFIERALADNDAWEKRTRLSEAQLAKFGTLVAAASSPIDDVRGLASYRSHAVAVMARRTLTWAWSEYCENR
ncbi:MAG: FAD binding domain-containing protein [Actinomycetota bacterium]